LEKIAADAKKRFRNLLIKSIMQKFKELLNKKINPEKLKNLDKINEFGITIRYQPEIIEYFDEIEFGIMLKNGKIIAFPVTIENFLISRILFGMPDANNPDILLPLSNEEFEKFLKEKEQDILDFFSYLTE
jgi:hypothetical protein